jgi:hypothetical protein
MQWNVTTTEALCLLIEFIEYSYSSETILQNYSTRATSPYLQLSPL